MKLDLAQLFTFLKALNTRLPQLEDYLTQVEANPALLGLAEEAFPGLKQFDGHLPEVKKWIDFFRVLLGSLVSAFPNA